MKTFIATILIFAVCTPIAFARKSVDTTGKNTFEAEFVDFKNGKVQLKKENGKMITLPIGRLSKEDQEYVNNMKDKNDPLNKEEQKLKAENSPSQKPPKATKPVRTSNDQQQQVQTPFSISGRIEAIDPNKIQIFIKKTKIVSGPLPYKVHDGQILHKGESYQDIDILTLS